MPAGHAQAQMDPCVANLQTLFTAIGARSYLVDLIEMCASHISFLTGFEVAFSDRGTGSKCVRSPTVREGKYPRRPSLIVGLLTDFFSTQSQNKKTTLADPYDQSDCLSGSHPDPSSHETTAPGASASYSDRCSTRPASRISCWG